MPASTLQPAAIRRSRRRTARRRAGARMSGAFGRRRCRRRSSSGRRRGAPARPAAAAGRTRRGCDRARRFARRLPAVVRVAVVGDRPADSRRARPRARPSAHVRARRPVEPRRPVVGARKRHRRGFEQIGRVSAYSPCSVRPPAGLPGRAIGERARAETADTSRRRHFGGLSVVVREDVVGARGRSAPIRRTARGVGVDERADEREVFVSRPSSRSALEVRSTAASSQPDGLRRGTRRAPSRAAAIAPQVEVALGLPQLGASAIPAGGALGDKRFVGAPRLGVASSGEQMFRARSAARLSRDGERLVS